jgi:hypothetical protein
MMFFWIGRGLLRSAARGSRSAPVQPAQSPDNGAAGTLTFMFLLPWMIVIFKQGYDGHVTGTAVVNYICWFFGLMIVAGVLSALAKHHGNRAVLEKYQPPEEPDVTALMRTRAFELGGLQQGRGERVADLFSVPCPEVTCAAVTDMPCNMGIGIPVLLVDKNPVTFCHVARMENAVAHGTARYEDIAAQFGGKIPESIGG